MLICQIDYDIFDSMFTKIISLPRRTKILFMVFCDFILLPLAYWSAIALRLGSSSYDPTPYFVLFFSIPFLTIPIFIRFGLYRAVIRFLDDKIIYTILSGVTLSVLVITCLIALWRFPTLPRSSILIYWFMATAYIAVSRYSARGLIRRIENSNRGQLEKVAIYGAGQVGLQVALTLNQGRMYKPIAFFDDNKQLHKSTVAGLTVYNPERLLEVMESNDCRQLLLAMPNATRAKKNDIVKRFEGSGITLQIVPNLNELIDGRLKVEDIREVGVEDLLGRDPIPPIDKLILKCVSDKCVLVTGAGGSIGSELCRQIIKLNPKLLILYEFNEFNLYKLEQEFQKNNYNVGVIYVLGDVLNTELLHLTVKNYSVQTIYHAAAYKHVPLVEGNISAGIINNVFGTLNVAKVALEKNVQNVVLISTDKAVRPTNVMGATKRLAELVIQAYAEESFRTQQITKFCMVRFGNVLGSSGSVLPLFKEQIRLGGPLTVTHPDVTRYFMTIPEATQLVLQAGSLTTSGDVFVLDMGESIKIVELAKKMIELSGFAVYDEATQEGDISIKFTGLRPGEKLFEELLIGQNSEWTEHPRIMRAKETKIEFAVLITALEDLKASCFLDKADVNLRKKLKDLVPEFVND